MDENIAKQLKPKLAALRSYIRSVSLTGEFMDDNDARSEFDAMYEDISKTLNDPNLSIYAPPIPHLGTTGPNQALFPDHQAIILTAGYRLITYIEALLKQNGLDQQPSKQALHCFLAHPFDDVGQNYADNVKQLLELQGISVSTGEKFEPRSVSKKIRELLSRKLDFGVLIIAGGKESVWSRDEVSQLWSEEKYVIVLVEEGTSFTQGIHGDLEWIPFKKDHINDAFIKLLEGIEFIKRNIR